MILKQTKSEKKIILKKIISKVNTVLFLILETLINCLEQEVKRKKHLERRNAAKQRRKQTPQLERNEPKKPEKERILIVCEGKNTEPSYFNLFRLTSTEIEAIGDGKNTVSLVFRS